MAKQQEQNTELELLKAKLELLEGKVTKHKTSEEEFHARVAKYEASKEQREALKAQIEKRRLEIMQLPELMGKARLDEVILLEAWERRAKDIESTNPSFAERLRYEFKKKVRDIQKDPMR